MFDLTFKWFFTNQMFKLGFPPKFLKEHYFVKITSYMSNDFNKL